MTDKEKWALEMMRHFSAAGLSGELVIRFRDGAPVEAEPRPRYKAPAAGVKAKDTGRGFTR
jgi:hypothetical protein